MYFVPLIHLANIAFQGVAIPSQRLACAGERPEGHVVTFGCGYNDDGFAGHGYIMFNARNTAFSFFRSASETI